jgi:hypothetical protein
MKIKLDFVTNSSTVTYLISTPIEIDQDQLHIHPSHSLESFEVFKTLEELTVYTQSEDSDWITKVTGPYRFWGLCEEHYLICKQIISDGNIAIDMSINNNFTDQMGRVETLLGKKGAKIMLRQHD